MEELIKVKNSRLEEYETLLTERDNLRKEALCYENEYIREFGKDILELFKIKIECVKKKKMISYCQMMRNRNQEINHELMYQYIESEMKSYYAQLDQMVEEHEASKKTRMLSEKDLLDIKRIYRGIAKKIHPDMNPTIAENVTIKELWNRVVVAYECNSLPDLEELEVLVNKAIEDEGIVLEKADIPNLDEKIEQVKIEIDDIRNTDPYLFKDILNDFERIEEKKASLKEEYESYVRYEAELDELLETFKMKGVDVKWQVS